LAPIESAIGLSSDPHSYSYTYIKLFQKYSLDKHWLQQDIKYNWECELLGTGSRSYYLSVKSFEFLFKFFTARCTLVQRAVLRSLIACRLSVRL